MERIVLNVGETELLVEVARSEEEKARGLMFREDLGNLDGMLFLFQEDRRLSFWMKNTLLPLSIAYISSDGVIREIYPLEPGSLLPVESRRSLRYALEVPRGLFEEKDIVPGDRIVFPEDFKP
ncbi:MAG: DUF192 domain-containing protein [Spirochaetales bacterium]|nr:DUF192 domain-containing protein [Spirochaetales bacterium]